MQRSFHPQSGGEQRWAAIRDWAWALTVIGFLVVFYLLFVDSQGNAMYGKGLLRGAQPHINTTCLNDTYSQFAQDQYILRNLGLPTSSQGIYVELGAYHPLRFSNTALFDRCFQWQGLCIDINPFYAAEFVQERSCTFVQACVVDNGTRAYYLRDDAEGNGKEGVGSTPCEPFGPLLARHGITHIDLLSVDVEGGELEALRTFPFDRIPLRAVLVETYRVGKEAVFDLLEDRGFVHVAELGPDDLFVGPEWEGGQPKRPWFPPRYGEWRAAVRAQKAEEERDKKG